MSGTDVTALGVPRYCDLPREPTTGEPYTWTIFEPNDQRGALSLLGPEQALAGARSVRRGATFSLNWRVDLPDPPILGRRRMHRTTVDLGPGTDDFYDAFYTQSSSQWDALKHVGHDRLGYWHGFQHNDVMRDVGSPLGIEHWAQAGIVSRFTLIDVAASRGEYRTDPATVDELEEVLARQGTQIEPGDVLLVRFGWTSWYDSLDAATRQQLTDQFLFDAAGLSPALPMAEWLWDHGCLALASDVPAFEAMPFDKSSFDGFLHYRLVVLLGMAIGELFDLEGLALDAQQDGEYHGLFTAAPLNMPGGSGSPANALAIK